MKTKLPLLACLSILLASIVDAQTTPEPAQWARYTAKDEEFSVTLSSTGQVTNISVVSGLPYGLTERAIAAARRIKFVPR